MRFTNVGVLLLIGLSLTTVSPQRADAQLGGLRRKAEEAKKKAEEASKKSTADTAKTPGPRYEVRHEWGDGAHSDAHGGAILPDILRWIWPK